MHKLGAYVHTSARYEVFMMKAVTGMAVTDADNDDNDTQWTEHDCIGSLPNEPKSTY